MPILSPASIKEVTRELTDGYTCFIHKRSAKITVINLDSEDAEEIAAQKEIQVGLEGKPERFLKIEPMPEKDLLVIMRDFLEEVADRGKRKQLSNALNRKKPVRNFMQEVESDMELRQHWKNHGFEAYQDWVSEFVIDAYNF
ncbi:MAG: hypothetical protein ACI8YQ_003938 [Polaribacter sp.]|jgi:hypothetical protein